MTFRSPFGRPFSPPFEPNSLAMAGGIVVYDEFTDTDNVTLPNHTPNIYPVGSSWNNANLGIVTNKVKILSGNRQIALINSGVYNCTISVDVSYLGTQADNSGYRSAIVFRNSWIVGFNLSGSYLRLYDNGTLVASSANVIGGEDGDTHALKVVLSGNDIKVYFDGDLSISYTGATNNTATTHGFRLGYDSTNGGRADNFKVEV